MSYRKPRVTAGLPAVTYERLQKYAEGTAQEIPDIVRAAIKEYLDTRGVSLIDARERPLSELAS